MSGQTILVIDDSPTILKLVELTLAKSGYRVLTAETGESGIETAQSFPPDMILLDYLLPDLKGDDLCRAISAQTALAKVPVVVMSAKGEEISESFNTMNHVVNIISKPFSPEALLAVVVHTLQQKAASTNEKSVPRSDSNIELGTLLSDEEAPKPIQLDDLVGIALAGDLTIIAIADVLLLIQDRSLTGVLEITHARARLDIFLKEGRIEFAGAHDVPEEFLLGRFLVSGGHLSEDRLRKILVEREKDKPNELLGAYLRGRGLLTSEGLHKAMTKQTMALVFECLRWGNGRFAFRPQSDLPPLAEEAKLDLPADGLILEGLRRVEEWRVIEQEIGSFELTFVRDEDKLQGFGRNKLLREEIQIVDLVNGKHTVRDIIQLSKLGSYEVSQILFRLLRSRLIRRRVGPLAI
jgi:CheY-like chemotaxis protein